MKKAGHKGEVAHFTFTAHKAKQMRERFSSSLSFCQTDRTEGRNKVVNCQRVDIFAWPDNNSCLEFDNIHIKVARSVV